MYGNGCHIKLFHPKSPQVPDEDQDKADYVPSLISGAPSVRVFQLVIWYGSDHKKSTHWVPESVQREADVAADKTSLHLSTADNKILYLTDYQRIHLILSSQRLKKCHKQCLTPVEVSTYDLP